MTLPMKQAKTAIQPQKPPSGAGGAILEDFLGRKNKEQCISEDLRTSNN